MTSLSPGPSLFSTAPDQIGDVDRLLVPTPHRGLPCVSGKEPSISLSATSLQRDLRRDWRAARVVPPTVADLVAAAADRDKDAWDALVVRFAPLVLSVTGGFRLSPDDAADVSQTVWLRLLQHIDGIREPAALPGWIVTTARNECLRLLNERQRVLAVDPLLETSPAGSAIAMESAIDIAEDLAEEIERAELHSLLVAAFGELPDRDRQLLRLLLTDPPTPYTEISVRMGMPVGGIGPNRARALDRLRQSRAFAAYRRRHDPR